MYYDLHYRVLYISNESFTLLLHITHSSTKHTPRKPPVRRKSQLIIP